MTDTINFSNKSAVGQQDKGTIDDKERAHFAEQGKILWKEGQPLQLMNQVNVPAIVDALVPPTEANRVLREGPLPLRGFRILDAGCGGGLLSEPLAKLGVCDSLLNPHKTSANATAFHFRSDGRGHRLRAGVARHRRGSRQTGPGARESGRLRYVCSTIEEYYSSIVGCVSSNFTEFGECVQVIPPVPPEAAFDLVVASGVVKHVADVPLFVRYVVAFVRPGGALYFMTINRTWRAFFVMILITEYVLRFLPRGTHHYAKLVSPEELRIQLEKSKYCRNLSPGTHISRALPYNLRKTLTVLY